MYFKQISHFYKFYVKIQVIKYDMNPNIYLNNSRKTPPIPRQRCLNEVSHKTFVTIRQSFATYSRVRNKHTGTLINFWGFFSRGYVLIKGGYVYWFLSKKNFLRIFNFLFLWLCIKESNYLLFKRGLHLFKRLCLLFLPNVPGATFIQGGTSIPEYRVGTCVKEINQPAILF